MEAKGINLRQNARKEINVGIHVETFVQLLSSIPTTDAGYINLLLVPNHVPSRKGGYTHKAVIVPQKEKAA